MSLINFCGYLLKVGPFVLPPRMNGENYLEFLQEELPVMLDALGLPPEIRNNIVFMHDGAGPHFANIVTNFLNEEYPDRWIGRGGPIRWPARSPDLNPLDYFLWGYIKNYVYRQTMADEAATLQLIQDTARIITPEILGASTRAFEHRLLNCLNCNGSHFEQFN